MVSVSSTSNARGDDQIEYWTFERLLSWVAGILDLALLSPRRVTRIYYPPILLGERKELEGTAMSGSRQDTS